MPRKVKTHIPEKIAPTSSDPYVLPKFAPSSARPVKEVVADMSLIPQIEEEKGVFSSLRVYMQLIDRMSLFWGSDVRADRPTSSTSRTMEYINNFNSLHALKIAAPINLVSLHNADELETMTAWRGVHM